MGTLGYDPYPDDLGDFMALVAERRSMDAFETEDGLTPAQRLRLADIEADEDRARRRRADLRRMEREMRELHSRLQTLQGIVDSLEGRLQAQDRIIQAQRRHIQSLQRQLMAEGCVPAGAVVTA